MYMRLHASKLIELPKLLMDDTCIRDPIARNSDGYSIIYVDSFLLSNVCLHSMTEWGVLLMETSSD